MILIGPCIPAFSWGTRNDVY